MNEVTADKHARVLAVAELSMEAQAIGEAALVCDWEEARFRSFRVMDQAFGLQSKTVAQAGHSVSAALGPPGSVPNAGYGAALVVLAEAISRLL